ncbi:phosphatase PAP2 family protein [Salinibius halmophilus]|uniref:phosphatase PAP2 family protein n=1 Tax=Salinibius halmophilus TaxID=1853216 RepID=UPI000E6758D5|nr:phosphatase PAP2 family protein [Salinibius halmophilus]
MLRSFIHRVHRLDAAVFLWMLSSRYQAFWQRLSRMVSRSGDGWWYAGLFLALLLLDVINQRFFLVVLQAFTIERAIYFVMKNGLRRNRPQDSLDNFVSYITPHDRFSLPSGHASAAFLTATILTFLAPVWAIMFYFWAGLVGTSRIMMGVHFPGDVIIGAVLGSIAAHSTLSFML